MDLLTGKCQQVNRDEAEVQPLKIYTISFPGESIINAAIT